MKKETLIFWKNGVLKFLEQVFSSDKFSGSRLVTLHISSLNIVLFWAHAFVCRDLGNRLILNICPHRVLCMQLRRTFLSQYFLFSAHVSNCFFKKMSHSSPHMLKIVGTDRFWIFVPIVCCACSCGARSSLSISSSRLMLLCSEFWSSSLLCSALAVVDWTKNSVFSRWKRELGPGRDLCFYIRE